MKRICLMILIRMNLKGKKLRMFLETLGGFLLVILIIYIMGVLSRL
jgi:hypothetical protein